MLTTQNTWNSKKGPVIFLLLVKHMELHSSLQQEHLLKYCLCRRVSTGKFYQVILVKSQQISQAAFSLSRSFQPILKTNIWKGKQQMEMGDNHDLSFDVAHKHMVTWVKK